MNLAEVVDFLSGVDDAGLFAEADRVRQEVFGSEVFLRGIVEFSNHCNKSCHYCGLRAPNRTIPRYRLSREEILAGAALAAELDLGTVVLQSGDDFRYSAAELAWVVAEIKERHGLAVTLSLGDRPLDEYRLLFQAGADRALLKLETLEPELHNRLRPGETFAARLARVRGLQEIGYEVGSGIITGLPGVSMDVLARDILGLTDLGLHMISAGPYVCNPGTPLAGSANGDLRQALRSVALLRILNPLANIPATSSLEVLATGARSQVLGCGANVIMPSLTPERVRREYAIYPGKNANDMDLRTRTEAIKEEIRRAGLRPSAARGQSPLRNLEEKPRMPGPS